jgi:hypothetical protein
MRVVSDKNQNLALVALMLATFFNPLGFDILLKSVMDWTGSYWITICIFYLLSVSFFGLYFWLSGKNPIKYFIKKFRKNKYEKLS